MEITQGARYAYRERTPNSNVGDLNNKVIAGRRIKRHPTETEGSGTAKQPT